MTQMPFHVVDNFLQLPDNIYRAEVVQVSVDSDGHIYVVHRGQHPILEFNPDGSSNQRDTGAGTAHALRPVIPKQLSR